MMKRQSIRAYIMLLFFLGLTCAVARADEEDFIDLESLLGGADPVQAEALRAAEARIAELEQRVADRDEIIIQMSDAAPDAERQAIIRNLEDENRLLRERIAELVQRVSEIETERDQIRSDFNRLFDEGTFPVAVAAVEADDGKVQELEARIPEFEARVAGLEKQVERQQEALADAKSETERLSASLLRVQGERDGLARQLEAAGTGGDDEELRVMQANLEETRALLQGLQTSLEATQQEKASLAQDLERRQATAEEEARARKLQEELAAKHAADLEETRVLLQDLQTSYQSLEQEKAILALQLEERAATAIDESKARALQEEVAAMRAVDQERKATMDDLFRQLSVLRGEISSREATNEALSETVREQEALLKEWEQTASRKAIALQSTQEEKDMLAATLARAREEIDALKKALEASELAVSKANELRLTLENEIKRLEQEDERQRRTLDATLTELALARRAVIEKEDETQQVTDALARKQAEVSQWQEAFAEREAAVQSLEQERAAAGQAAHAAEREIEGLRAKIAGLEELLAGHGREKAVLQEEVERLGLVQDRRRRAMDDLLAELAVAERRAEEAEALLGSVEARYAASQKEIEDQLLLLTERNALLEQEVLAMETDLEQARLREASLAEAAGEGADLAGVLQGLQAEKAALERQVATLEQQQVRDIADGDGAAWQAERSELQQILAESQAEVSRLREALAAGHDGDSADGALLRAEFEQQITQYEQSMLALEEQRQKLELLLADREEVAMAEEKRMEALASELAAARAENEALKARVESMRPVDVRETDLYRELEEVNAVMREKLVEVETARQRLARQAEEAQATLRTLEQERDEARQRGDRAESALAGATEREQEYKDLLAMLGPQVADLEARVTSLMREREALAGRLLEREDEISSLKVELEKREHRLLRAERVAEVLERARSEVEQTGRRQRLNMHYNMASVYAREGKFGEAEHEYLQALRLDPNDADVHYNLGILYDDELQRPDKAVLHYRRYLQLNPHGTDADRVRSWLMRLELEQRR